MARGYGARGVDAGVRRLLLALVLLAVCPSAAGAADLRVDGARFADRQGREVILRGGALIKKSAPGLPVMTERDWENVRALGWNSLRLGTAWEHVEPRDGEYDAAYLDAFAALAREAMDRGLYVVIDFHQDVWGKPAGNGHPAWTTYSECDGTHVDLASAAGTFAANYFSPFTVCQFTRFWADTAMQERYAAALAQVARRIGDHPRLAGYDVMNEPFQGAVPPAAFEVAALFPFYKRVTDAVRAVNPDALMFLEPANAKNVHLPTATAAAALPDGSAYAPHVYGLWDANDAFTERAALVDANMAFSAAEADAMGVPLWYGEFGMRRSAPEAEATVTQIYERADEQRAGASVWEYARNEYGVLRADGSLDPARAATVARPYPARTAGSLSRFAYDGERFELEWTATRGRTLLALPGEPFEIAERSAGLKITRTSAGMTVRAEAGPRRLVLSRP